MAEEKKHYLSLSAKDVLWYAKSFEMSPVGAMRDIYIVGNDAYFLNYLILMRKAHLRIHEHVRAYIAYFTRNTISKHLDRPSGIDYDVFVLIHYFVPDVDDWDIANEVAPHREKIQNTSDFKYFSIRKVVDDVLIHGKKLEAIAEGAAPDVDMPADVPAADAAGDDIEDMFLAGLNHVN